VRWAFRRTKNRQAAGYVLYVRGYVRYLYSLQMTDDAAQKIVERRRPRHILSLNNTTAVVSMHVGHLDHHHPFTHRMFIKRSVAFSAFSVCK